MHHTGHREGVRLQNIASAVYIVQSELIAGHKEALVPATVSPRSRIGLGKFLR